MKGPQKKKQTAPGRTGLHALRIRHQVFFSRVVAGTTSDDVDRVKKRACISHSKSASCTWATGSSC